MTEVSVSQSLGGQFEAKFRSHGVEWTFVAELPLDKITTDHGVQVRLADIAPKERVARYKEQMLAGAAFPPITVRDGDFALLDGNTRVQAAAQIGRSVLPAYIVKPRNAEEALTLAGAINQLGGKDLEPEDAKRVALIMARRGKPVSFIAKELGVAAAKVTRWQNVEEGRKHAAALGVIDGYEGLSQNQQELLSRVVRDEVFGELVATLEEHKPVAGELQQLVKRVNTAGSDEAAMEDVRRTALAWPEADGQKSSAKSPALAAVAAIDKLLESGSEHWVDVVQADQLLPRWERLEALARAVVESYRRVLAV